MRSPTFLRTIGVNAVLAQTVNTCLATAYRAPVFTVRSVIGRSDDLMTGKSYYRDEVEAVLAELLRTRADQTDAAHIVIVATHDRELVDLMQGVYVSHHFRDTVGSDGLSFDYQLQEGPAHSWNAIALLEICGAPARVVKRAYGRTADLDDQRRIGQGSDSD